MESLPTNVGEHRFYASPASSLFSQPRRHLTSGTTLHHHCLLSNHDVLDRATDRCGVPMFVETPFAICL